MRQGIHFEVYQRVDRLWDWRLKAGNGRIVATSAGQGFRDPSTARRAIVAILDAINEVLGFHHDASRLPIVELEPFPFGDETGGTDADEAQADDGHDVGWNTQGE